MAEAPTDREIDAMRAIFATRAKRGFPPTRTEICAALKISTKSKRWAQDLVLGLKRKGLATEVEGRHGTLDLTQLGRDFLLGRAA